MRGNRRRVPLISAVMVLALIAVACGGDSEPTDTTTSTTSQPSESSSSGSGAGNGSGEGTATVNGEYPIDAPPGIVIDVLAEIGLSTDQQANLLYPPEDFDRIVAFYDEWTANQEDEHSRTEADNEISYFNMTDPLSIVIRANEEERNQVWTRLQLLDLSPEGS